MVFLQSGQISNLERDTGSQQESPPLSLPWVLYQKMPKEGSSQKDEKLNHSQLLYDSDNVEVTYSLEYPKSNNNDMLCHTVEPLY